MQGAGEKNKETLMMVLVSPDRSVLVYIPEGARYLAFFIDMVPSLLLSSPSFD